MGLKPYSRADAEALRVLSQLATGQPHEGCGEHVQYWLNRGWCCVVWYRSGADDNGYMKLRMTAAGRREVSVWNNRVRS